MPDNTRGGMVIFNPDGTTTIAKMNGWENPDFDTSHPEDDEPESKKKNDCPKWMPESLCSGYSQITKYAKYIPYLQPFGAVTQSSGLMADAIQKTSDKLSTYYVRAGLFILGLVLVIIALVFIFKDTAVETVLPIAKAIK